MFVLFVCLFVSLMFVGLNTHLYPSMASWNIFFILEITAWSEQSQAVKRIAGRRSLKGKYNVTKKSISFSPDSKFSLNNK